MTTILGFNATPHDLQDAIEEDQERRERSTRYGMHVPPRIIPPARSAEELRQQNYPDEK